MRIAQIIIMLEGVSLLYSSLAGYMNETPFKILLTYFDFRVHLLVAVLGLVLLLVSIALVLETPRSKMLARKIYGVLILFIGLIVLGGLVTNYELLSENLIIVLFEALVMGFHALVYNALKSAA